MAKKNVKVNYDEDSDMISLFLEDSRSKFSVDISLPKGEIIIDFGFNGQIVGLEFFNASNYFPFLKNLKGEKIKANLKVQYGKEWAEINYEIFTQGAKPVSNIIISPYNKELILQN